MKLKKIGDKYLLRLVKGESVMEQLLLFCEKNNVIVGELSGIGGASEIELGYYDLDTKEYEWKTFNDVCEVLILNGNISLVDGKPFIHAHMAISNRKLESFGGHLKDAKVGATLEVIISPIDAKIERELDEAIGLKLLDLPD